MKKILVPFFIFSVMQLSAQNLISNPGFENYSALPTGYGQFNLAIGWDNCSGGGTPEYFNTAGTALTYFCSGCRRRGPGCSG